MTFSLQVVCIDCGGPVEAGKNRCAAHLRHTPDRKASQPRALVALSGDQEWLAMLEPVDQVMMWGVFRRDWDDDKRPWVYEATVFDTGQDANEVLAQFLEGRSE